MEFTYERGFSYLPEGPLDPDEPLVYRVSAFHQGVAQFVVRIIGLPKQVFVSQEPADIDREALSQAYDSIAQQEVETTESTWRPHGPDEKTVKVITKDFNRLRE